MGELLQRIGAGLISMIIGTFCCFILVYAFYCGVNGWNWAIDISTHYGLLIIRVIVVAALSIISILIVPFKYYPELLFYGKYAFYIGGGIGFLIGFFILTEDKPNK